MDKSKQFGARITDKMPTDGVRLHPPHTYVVHLRPPLTDEVLAINATDDLRVMECGFATQKFIATILDLDDAEGELTPEEDKRLLQCVSDYCDRIADAIETLVGQRADDYLRENDGDLSTAFTVVSEWTPKYCVMYDVEREALRDRMDIWLKRLGITPIYSNATIGSVIKQMRSDLESSIMVFDTSGSVC